MAARILLAVAAGLYVPNADAPGALSLMGAYTKPPRGSSKIIRIL
jgi:hypothetical protein